MTDSLPKNKKENVRKVFKKTCYSPHGETGCMRDD
jgi:hypothetical protein